MTTSKVFQAAAPFAQRDHTVDSLNGTSADINYSSEAYTDSAGTRDYISLLLVLLPILTIFGNTLVVLSIGCFKHLRKITYQMIFSLAISDLLIGLLVMPFSISNEVVRYWPYGRMICHVWHSVDVLASTASILNLCIIAMDRYWAVTKPIKYPRLMSKTRGWVLIILVWICSAAISFPMIFWWNRLDKYVAGECNFTSNPIYLILSSLVSFYIPVSVMGVVYLKIYLVIRSQSRSRCSDTAAADSTERRGSVIRLRVHRGGTVQSKRETYEIERIPLNSGSKQPHNATLSNGPYLSHAQNGNGTLSEVERSPNHFQRLINRLQSSTTKRRTINNEYRVARTLAIVLGVFLVFWLPFFICNVAAALPCEGCDICSEFVFVFVTWLGHVNSAINPVIYALTMNNMREAFVHVLHCRFTVTKLTYIRDRHIKSSQRTQV